MKVTIYGRSRCSFCDQAKMVCKMKGFDYEYLLLDADYSIEEFEEKFPKAQTFPQICIGENSVHIGGYNDFKSFIDAETL